MSEALISDTEGEKLWVEIYKEPIEIPVESEKAGHPVYREVDFITIRVPGDQLNIIKRPLNEDDKKRFPRHWALFQNATDNSKVEGWLLEEWPAITRSIAFQLRTLGFKTVEHVANCTDGNLAKIGMACGMSPHTFRDKARAFLEVANDSAKAQQAVVERDAMAQRIKDLEDTVARLGALQGAAKAAEATAPAAPAPEPELSQTEKRARRLREQAQAA
jgi:hypothetical protein